MIYTSFCLYMCYRALTTLRRFQYFYIFLSYLKEGGWGGNLLQFLLLRSIWGSGRDIGTAITIKNDLRVGKGQV